MAMSNASPDFNLADGRGYMLGRSYAAASRLNFQYYLWRESLHFNIHPSISIPEKACIADVATGTAIWLVDVAREYPTAQLDGFDINTSQAPPKQWLPPNITLKTWNIFDDVPQHMIGIYDVIHLRLLVLVVQKSDPRKILRNLIRMLKPGGYIQWDELNYPGTHVKNSSNSLQTPALDELREMVYSRGRNDWTLQLPDFFVEEGLLDTEIYYFQDPPEFARANGEQHLLTMEEFASSLAEVGHKEQAAKIFQLIRDVGQEVLDGAALSMPRVVCVGRKVSGQIRPYPWYKADIGTRLKPVIERVFETWSGITGPELIDHLHKIRDRAFSYGEYPCVGQWMFLLPSISAFPEYPGIIDRAQSGATVLDLGCGFGQDLRLLAANGVSPENMYASDISPELWELGLDLFRDRARMTAEFIEADILDTASQLRQLIGRMDIIIACQFLHLFSWEQQIVAMKRVVEFSRPGSILIGYQRAQVQAQEISRKWGRMYYHSAETFREIWRQVECQTGTKWEVSVSMVDLQNWGMEDEDIDWMPTGPKGINFVVTRQG